MLFQQERQDAISEFDGPYHSHFNISGRWAWWRSCSI
jgi:hypothetical protein